MVSINIRADVLQDTVEHDAKQVRHVHRLLVGLFEDRTLQLK